MKEMKMADIEKMDKSSLVASIKEAHSGLAAIMLQKSTTGIERPHDVQVLRKNIARMNTFLNRAQ